MSLTNALSSATSGLDSISRQLALVSQNIANASTPDYARETLALSAASAEGQTFGVRSGPATRAMDEALQSNLLDAVGRESGEQVLQSALAGIDQVSGTPGSGQDLAGLLGGLRDSLSKLAVDPANSTQQRQVLNSAQTLVDGLHQFSGTLVSARQSAQDSLVQGVDKANTGLQAIGSLSDQIILGRARGETTADLENQRDVQMRGVAELTGAKFLHQPNGDVMAVCGGSVLSLRTSPGPFSIAPATLAPDTPAAAVPQLMVGGGAITGIGGQLGANLTLRDITVPTLQAGVDDIAQKLAAGTNAQGMTLFTDPTGVVPPAGTAGFAGTIQVSAAFQATPSMIRDGAAPAGAAGDPTLINKVLDVVFASGAGTLVSETSTLVSNTAALASASAARVDTNTAVRTSLQTKLSAQTGISVDSEMASIVRLQNAYGANAKVVSALQTIWTQLLGTIQ
ncbi:MAG: flagellar hook-associated protein FlgK [Acetobacteraceae bacterium]